MAYRILNTVKFKHVFFPSIFPLKKIPRGKQSQKDFLTIRHEHFFKMGVKFWWMKKKHSNIMILRVLIIFLYLVNASRTYK